MAELLERLLGYPGVRSALLGATDEPMPGPVLPMHFRVGTESVRLFTTLATLGTPRDVTLEELRIESFFPADEATRAALMAAR